MNLECPVCESPVAYVSREEGEVAILMTYEGDPVDKIVLEYFYAQPCGHEVVYGYDEEDNPSLYKLAGMKYDD